MAPDSSIRQMFELYLYDYLIKRNMHQTAETFRNEANIQLDPAASTIDVPEGFLLDWWSFSFDCDCFRAWLLMHEENRLEATQGYHASQDAGCSVNAEAINQLPDNFVPALNIESTSMPPHVTGEFPLFSAPSSYQVVSGELSQFLSPSSHQEVSGELPQLFLPPLHQEELLTSTQGTSNVAATNGQEVEPFGQNASNAEYTAFSEETDPMFENLLNSFWMFEQDQLDLFDKSALGESSRNRNNLQAPGEGDIDINEFASFPKDDDNKSETSDCSSNHRIIATNADASTAHQSESNKET